ncbi:MAG: ribonuclease HIII, partial [Bdellovibrionales bacterium]|nr:ribonuclease HIII [Bdellovibrionales bacterium]
AHQITISVSDIPYGEKWILKKLQDTVNLNFYTSGKWLIQGKESRLKNEIEGLFLEVSDTGDFTGNVIGSDESGKGHYFGPLVVCSFLFEESKQEKIKKIGAKDSKKLTDKKILEIADELKKYPHSLIVLNPSEYNFIYEQDKNLNVLLAKLHGEAVKSIVKNHKIDHIVIDQFAANASVITNHFKGVDAKVTTRFRAEEIPAVACASILARAHFVKAMGLLEKKYGLSFPKGASMEVEIAAENYVKKYGFDKLSEVAKLHFVTTQKILQSKLDV